MDDMTDWFIVPSTDSVQNPLENENNGSAESEKVEEVDVNQVEKINNENSSTEKCSSSSIPVIDEKEPRHAHHHKVPGPVNATELSLALTNLATNRMLSRGISSWSLPQTRRAHRTAKFNKEYGRTERAPKQTVDVSTNTEQQALTNVATDQLLSRGTSCRSLPSTRRINKTPQLAKAYCNYHRIEKKQKLNTLKQAVDVSTNTDHQDATFNTTSTSTANQRSESKFLDSKDVELFINIFLVLFIIIGTILCIKEDSSGSTEIQHLKNSITNLKRNNDLLKQQLLDDQEKENRRLEILTGHIFKQLKERENASKQQAELESFYQTEIHQLNKQVSVLEANHKTLRNHLKEVNSSIEETRIKQGFSKASNISNQVKHSDFSLEKFHNLILLYSQKLNLADMEDKPSESCFKTTFLDSPFSFQNFISNVSENFNIVKNYILDKCVTFQFDEFIDALKDRISMILSNFSQFLKAVKKYILKKDIKSRFVEYADVLKDGISTSFEFLQKSSMCLEQEEIKAAHKRKINRIRDTIDKLLVELNEY